MIAISILHHLLQQLYQISHYTVLILIPDQALILYFLGMTSLKIPALFFFGNVNQATVDSVHAKFTSGANLHFERLIVVDRDNLSLHQHRIKENFSSTSMWMTFERRLSSELMEKLSNKQASLDLFCIQN